MHYADIKYYDTQNGLGLRHSLFVSGCTHHCKGCFNSATWDFKYGFTYTQEAEDKLIQQFVSDEANRINIRGLSVLGGEPFDSLHGVTKLAQRFKDMFYDKDIWIWSGYTYEQIIQDKDKLKLLQLCDVLIDGRFIESQKDLTLRFRGSRNQRIIDVQQSLKNNKAVLYDI